MCSQTGIIDCITVSKSHDSIIAPNGYVYTLYLQPALLNLTFNDTDVSCSPFNRSNGEMLVVETLREHNVSPSFSSNLIPLASVDDPAMGVKWIGGDREALALYRVTGKFWDIDFDQYSGNVPPIEVVHGTALPPTMQLYMIDDVIPGRYPEHTKISNLMTGIPYFVRVSATNAIGRSHFSDVCEAIPSEVPPPVEIFNVGHALYVNEVQSLSVVGSLVNEVQMIQTKAMAILWNAPA